jgi:hypothetical protein
MLGGREKDLFLVSRHVDGALVKEVVLNEVLVCIAV